MSVGERVDSVRAAVLPRWLALLSYLLAAFLLVTTTTRPASPLVYPAWVLLLSVALARRARARPPLEGIP
jgi:hypothetical protein